MTSAAEITVAIIQSNNAKSTAHMKKNKKNHNVAMLLVW